MIEGVSEKIAMLIKQANPEETVSIERMTFALIILINGLIAIGGSMIIGFITGKPFETALGLFGFIALRFISGGYHFKTAISCTVVSIVAASALPHMLLSSNWVLSLTLTSIGLAFLFSPSNIERQSRIPPKYYPLLKILTVLVISTNFFFMSVTLAKAFFLQTVTLIHWKGGGRKDV